MKYWVIIRCYYVHCICQFPQQLRDCWNLGLLSFSCSSLCSDLAQCRPKANKCVLTSPSRLWAPMRTDISSQMQSHCYSNWHIIHMQPAGRHWASEEQWSVLAGISEGGLQLIIDSVHARFVCPTLPVCGREAGRVNEAQKLADYNVMYESVSVSSWWHRQS